MHFTNDETRAYRLYKQTGEGRDQLPYTPQFDAMLAEFSRVTGKTAGHHELSVLLVNTLKKGETNIKEFLETQV